MANDVTRAFEVDNGISFNNSIFMFEGEDGAEIALSPIEVTVGSVYIRYTGVGDQINIYQKLTHSPLTYSILNKSTNFTVDGGFPDSVYLASQIVDGGTP